MMLSGLCLGVKPFKLNFELKHTKFSEVSHSQYWPVRHEEKIFPMKKSSVVKMAAESDMTDHN